MIPNQTISNGFFAITLVVVLIVTTASNLKILGNDSRWLNLYPDRQAREFWSWFSEHESEIYSARSDEDPVIGQLEQRLRNYDPNLTFNLCWSTQNVYPRTVLLRRCLKISSLVHEGRSCRSAEFLVACAEMKNVRARYQNLLSLEFIELGKRWAVELDWRPFCSCDSLSRRYEVEQEVAKARATHFRGNLEFYFLPSGVRREASAQLLSCNYLFRDGDSIFGLSDNVQWLLNPCGF